jgi:SAM-dependent methyltransferase
MISMSEYWNNRFKSHGMVWGDEPSPTAIHASEIFTALHLKSVLVPGGGYGRNTKALSTHFHVESIELSEDAIKIAQEWDPASHFIQGSVLDIDLGKTYDAVYCFDVLQLFMQADRLKLIQNCVQHLKDKGLMYFTCFSNQDKRYGIGREVEPGTFEYKQGKPAHFFTEEDLKWHFKGLHIVEIGSIEERIANMNGGTDDYLLRYIVIEKVDR